MTACVNDNQKKGGYGKAVSATLAGVLAVGMVPATALAADGDATVTSDEGIDLLAATLGQAISQGSISAAKDNDGTAISDLTDITFTANGDPQYVIPTQIKPAEMDPVNLLKADGSVVTNYTITYYFDDGKGSGEIAGTDIDDATELGTLSAVEADDDALAEVGVYYVVVSYSNNGDTGSLTLKYEIEASPITGAYIYEVGDKDSDVSDTDFTYTGSALELKAALNGKPLDGATVTFATYTATDNDNAKLDSGAPLTAGKYVATISKDGASVQELITVNALDLSTADITMSAPTNNAAPAVTNLTINGEAVAADALGADLDLSYLNRVQDGTTYYDGYSAKYYGTYTYTVSAKSGDKNVTGSKTVTFDLAEDEATFEYDGATFANKTVYLDGNDAGSDPFAASEIKVLGSDGKALPSSAYTVTYTNNETGAAATAADLQTPGEWKVTVTVNAANTGYAYYGTDSFVVTVWQGQVDASANLYFKYDGKVAGDSASAIYDGSDMLSDIAVAMTDSEGNAVPASAYELEVQKTTEADGTTDLASPEDVDSIIDAGKYTIVVSSDVYELVDDKGAPAAADDLTFTFTVSQVNAATLQVADTQTIDGVEDALPYTGSTITPVIEYDTDEKDAAGNAIYATLPTDAYEATYAFLGDDPTTDPGEAVDEIKDPGYYKISVASSGENDNYDVTPDDLVIYVSDYKLFQDVPTDAWFAADVKAANDQKYMFGYNGGSLFGPNDAIKRGDVAMVLARMGGLDLNADSQDEVTSNVGYVTPFSDVDPNLYYAQAIAWCANTGIITGYGDTGLFKPEAPVTREEFATMLARYAKACGTDIAADADVLDGYTDASAIADWAKPFVEWTVSDKIMGVNTTVLNPTSKVTRAEVAAMAVRYQPKALKA